MDPASDAVLERALLAVGRTRALGLHFYGHFIGLSGSLPTSGRSRLRLEGEPPDVGAAAVSPVALAALADLAMSAAVRSLIDPGAWLATVTFSLQHPGAGVAGPLDADATAPPVVDGMGLARCSIDAAGRAVGQAQAWFAAPPAPLGAVLRLTPWERAEHPPVVVPTLGELAPDEAAAVAAARAAGERAAARGTAVSQEILAFEWGDCPAGRSSGMLRIGPELGNRVGHVQGGALYGAAALAAIRALDERDAVLVDGHYQYLRPADRSTLLADGEVLRRGRSVAFVEARLRTDAAELGRGLFSFRL